MSRWRWLWAAYSVITLAALAYTAGPRPRYWADKRWIVPAALAVVALSAALAEGGDLAVGERCRRNRQGARQGNRGQCGESLTHSLPPFPPTPRPRRFG